MEERGIDKVEDVVLAMINKSMKIAVFTHALTTMREEFTMIIKNAEKWNRTIIRQICIN